jgi:nitrate reductase (NAD(P)H)
LVKVYFKNVHPNFPEGGLMSQYLYEMEIGQSISLRGPFGKLKYLGDGNFEKLIKFKPRTVESINAKHLVFLAGGSGITPFYQVRTIFYILRLFNQPSKIMIVQKLL